MWLYPHARALMIKYKIVQLQPTWFFNHEQPHHKKSYFRSDSNRFIFIPSLNVASTSAINVTSTAEMSLHTIKTGLTLFFPQILNAVDALKNS